jgi:DNA modification methylase
MSVRVINADVMDGLAQLPDESVHCVVTSPPYWGLRDYGAPGQIGLEPTLAEHIAKLVEVFREVRRVLRNDGTLWLNYGDAYAGSWGAQSRGEEPGPASPLSGGQVYAAPKGTHTGSMKRTPGLKPKDLMLMPERLAIALQDDGWYVRSRIIWHKPNPMPESVTDRPTKSHEHIWMMSRAPRYFYDADAIRETATFDRPNSPESIASPYGQGFARRARSAGNKTHKHVDQYHAEDSEQHRTKAGLMKIADTEWLSRNARDVWTIATAPFSEAHFATFPPELAERCIKAGCPAGGTVLDPFGGSGTTGLVADRLQRSAVLIELNTEYAEMARRRVTNDCPLFTEAAE